MAFWDEVRNLIRREVAAAMTLRGRTRMGTVSGYDPSTYSVKVTLQPEGVLTGWIPLGALQIGNGWGVYCPPNIGDQIKTEPLEGDHDSRVATHALYSVVDQPLAVPAGEIWFVHKTGSFVKLVSGGDVEINAEGNLSATVSRNLSGNVSGNVSLEVEGDLSADVTGNISLTCPQVTITGNLSVSEIITMGGLEVLTAP